MGVNVCYAPVADVVATRDNPALGIRGFGSEAAAVAGMVAATVRGLRSAGVAATAKHFPGKGGARSTRTMRSASSDCDELGSTPSNSHRSARRSPSGSIS
jgi:beta-glucosidase-like glycosyl hydrolase